MDNRNNNSGGGFLFGLLIGGAIVFLVGTDKGRKILKSLTDEGMDELSEVLERAEEEIEDEEPALIARKEGVVEEEEISAPSTNGIKSNDSTSTLKRRFFRRPRS